MDKYVAMTPAVYLGNGVKANKEDVFIAPLRGVFKVTGAKQLLVSTNGGIVSTILEEDGEHPIEYYTVKIGDTILVDDVAVEISENSLTEIEGNEDVCLFSLPKSSCTLQLPIYEFKGAGTYYTNYTYSAIGISIYNEGTAINFMGLSSDDLSELLPSKCLRCASAQGTVITFSKECIETAKTFIQDLTYAFAFAEISDEDFDALLGALSYTPRYSFMCYKGSGLQNPTMLLGCTYNPISNARLEYMFYKHTSLQSASFNTGFLDYVCYECLTLKKATFNVNIVPKLDYGFYRCTSLAEVEGKNTNTTYSNLTTATYAFAYTNLTETNAHFTYTAQYTDRTGMYYRCPALETITMTTTVGVQDYMYALNTPEDLTSQADLADRCYMPFMQLPTLGSRISLSVKGMFMGRYNLVVGTSSGEEIQRYTLNISGTTTRDISYMFYRCNSLFENIHVTLNTLNSVEDASYMFYDTKIRKFTCESTATSVSGKLKNTSSMFDGCASLETVEGIFAPEIDYCARMFYNCRALKEFEAHDLETSPNYIAGYHDTRTGSGLSGKITYGFASFAYFCYSAKKITLGKAGGTFSASNAFANCIGILSTGTTSTLSMTALESAGTLIVDWGNCTNIDFTFTMGAMIGSQVGVGTFVDTVDFTDKPFNIENLMARDVTLGMRFKTIKGLTTTNADSVLRNIQKTISSTSGYESTFPYIARNFKCTGRNASFTFGGRNLNTGEFTSAKDNGLTEIYDSVFGDEGTNGESLFKGLQHLEIVDCPMPYGNLKEAFANCPKLTDVTFQSLYALSTAEGALDNSPSLAYLDFSKCVFIEDEDSTITFAGAVLSILTQSENITGTAISIHIPRGIASEITSDSKVKALQSAGKFGPITLV